ncbi:MAG: beta-ketoacyl-ACP synthase 3 [Alphaproteobacteria bacterium]
MGRARFVGVGAALPSQVIANAEIEDRLGVERGWIESRTGVRESRVLAAGDSLEDLAADAAREALRSSGLAASAVDLVVAATTSGPFAFPSLACLVHDRLGLATQPAFDVAAACAGFPHAISVADQAIRCGDHRTVLVIGADRLSALCEPSDRVTSPLFGDGAGAVVLRADDAPGESGILACRLRALGAQWPILYARARLPGAPAVAGGDDPWLRMQGADVFRAAVEHLVALTREVLATAGIEPPQVDLLVPHQANLRILRSMVSQLGIDEARVAVNLDRCGNTSAASIPIALADALAAGRIAAGSVVAMNAVGGGITAGALVSRW